MFVDELARFAAGAADARVTTIAETAATPLRVAVQGRRGVGCSTVARALDRAGSASSIRASESWGETDADLVVYVTTEVFKPEDSEAIGAIAARRPVLAMLNKADLAGFGEDGPIAAAQARCAHFAELPGLVGVPVEPMIGLLAVAALDDLHDTWAALRGLATRPAGTALLRDLFDGSFDEFLAAEGSLPAEDRLRVLNSLDLFGTALAVAAVRNGFSPAQLRALLRRVSCVDAVVAKIRVLGAEVRYRRVLDAVAALEALAVSGDGLGERIGRFLAHDDTVVARMIAAADLADAAGLPAPAVGDIADPAAHLARAVRWQRYGTDSAISDVQRPCAADITRGSLRLWSQACELAGSR